MDDKRITLCCAFLILFPATNYAEVFVQEGLATKTHTSAIQPGPDEAQAPSSFENRMHLEKQLRTTETSISNLTLKMAATKRELALEKDKMAQLSLDENQLNNKLIQQKQLLKKQINLSYRINDNSLLKALLSQNNIAEEEKTTVYIRHLNQAQLVLADQIKQTLITVQITKHALQAHSAALEALYAVQKNEQVKLEKNLQSRKALLAAL